MKTIALFFSLVLMSLLMHSQDGPQEITTQKGHTFLVGKINVDAFDTSPYTAWYSKNYDDYQVEEKIIAPHKSTLESFKILVFMGTWCGDSKRQVPRFIKILEHLDFSMENLIIVAVDRRNGYYKKSPTGEEWGLNIIKVPTFIFYKNGKEVNRIVESPIETLEKDMVKILSANAYTPNYSKTLHSD